LPKQSAGILSKVTGAINAGIDLSKEKTVIDMDKYFATTEIKIALKDYSIYQFTEANLQHHASWKLCRISRALALFA